MFPIMLIIKAFRLKRKYIQVRKPIEKMRGPTLNFKISILKILRSQVSLCITQYTKVKQKQN